MTAMVKGFGRRPQHDRPRSREAGVRKPPLEETAGRKSLCLGERDLWGFEGRGLSAGLAARAGGVWFRQFGRSQRGWSVAAP
jgi:hypothetical protein